MKYEDGLGPAREVHGGSGYWSQDSVVEVLGVSGKVTAVEVRWPGGKISTASVREGEREITIGQPD